MLLSRLLLTRTNPILGQGVAAIILSRRSHISDLDLARSACKSALGPEASPPKHSVSGTRQKRFSIKWRTANACVNIFKAVRLIL